MEKRVRRVVERKVNTGEETEIRKEVLLKGRKKEEVKCKEEAK